MQFAGNEKATQKVDTFDNCCDDACMKSKLSCGKTTGYLR